MKIGSKITLFYTGITIFILFTVISIFYISTTRYINTLFDSYLAEKAILTAQKHWEKDEVDDLSYLEIQKQYNELLPQAKEILFNADNPAVLKDSLANYLTPTQKQLLFKEKMVTFDQDEMRGTAIYYPDNEGNFVVIVMAQNNYGNKINRHTLLLAGTLMLIACICIYLIGKVYSNRMLYPLQSILKELKHIRAHNLKVRLKRFNNKDELDELTQSLNHMLDHIDTAFQAEKSFISNASHELNNPLTAIQGECEITLKKERSTQEYTEALQRISTESKRLSQLTRNLLFLARTEREIQQNIQENILLSDFLREIASENERIQLNIHHNTCSFLISANRHLLKIALMNVIDNALKYSTRQVELTIYPNSPQKVTIEIKDYGIGIPPQELAHITQAFYRGSNTRYYTGQGIGLNLTMKIISIYQGNIEFQSKENEYTLVKIELPSS